MLYAVSSTYYTNQKCLIVALGFLMFAVVYACYPIFVSLQQFKGCFFMTHKQHPAECLLARRQDITSKHLVKASLTMTTTITTKGTTTASYYFTITLNNINCHVIVIVTTTTSLYFGQFFSDFWKQAGTQRLRAVLCVSALFFQ